MFGDTGQRRGGARGAARRLLPRGWPRAEGELPVWYTGRDAPAWRCSGREADSVLKSRQAFLRCSINIADVVGRAGALLVGSFPECPAGRRTQKSPPCGGLRHSRWADRLPGLSSGGCTVMSVIGRTCRTIEKCVGRGRFGKGPLSSRERSPFRQCSLRLWPV